MATKITIPDFDFSAFYYPQLLEALINYKRLYVPEMTDETPYEPFIQLLRAFALTGHISNTTLDMIANESYLSTAKLVESVREHLSLIDYIMKPAVPSQVDMLHELAGVLASSTEVIPEGAAATTVASSGQPAVLFETIDAVTIDRTDQFSYVLAYDDSEGTPYTNYTTEANAGTDWTPWSTAEALDALYFGHKDIQWDKMNIDLSTLGAGLTGIYEFFGNHHYTIAPESVTVAASLEFNVNSILGTSDRSGSVVRVALNSTGAFFDATSTWDGENKIATIAGDFLGQTVASTIATDYTLSRDWYELSGLTDGTADLTVSDQDVSYTLPQSLTEYWQKTEVNSLGAYWIRYRLISVSGPTDPVLTLVTITDGKQYLLTSATQGETRLDKPYDSDGTADQAFETEVDYFILNSQVVTVEGEEWIPVLNFLSSEPTSKHYTILLGDNDRATITFGNGLNGAIPPSGSGNILIEYRHNSGLDGNVGSNTIITDKSGLIYVNKLWNPRAAAGWSESEGSSAASLERAKIAGPASLRIKDVALNGDDAAELAISYVDDDGASPFVRAQGFEGTLGPKTVELVVVAAGGAPATLTQLTDVGLYFNGDTSSIPKKKKRIVANTELTAFNYTPKLVDVTATVWGEVTAEAVENALTTILQPEALEDDGVTYVWDFGGEVATSRLIHEIFSVDDSIWKVDITTPGADITLETRELPVAQTITITVISS